MVTRGVVTVLIALMTAPQAAAQARADDERAASVVRLSGQARARYESFDGQFRAGFEGSDQVLLLRTLVAIEADAGPVTFGGELQDSRAYLDDAGSPISNSFVNALGVLQAYLRAPTANLLDAPDAATLTLGRQTIEIGSSRQIERVNYANVIKSFTGLRYQARSASGESLNLFAVVPIARRPSDRHGVADNMIEADEEQWGRLIWGAHLIGDDVAPQWMTGLSAEAFAYGLHERDTDAYPTPNRDYVTPGFRLRRTAQTGRADFEIEAAVRVGERRATSAPADTEDLDVFAGMVFAALGFTFDAPWRPRLALEYYLASGDEDPNDDRFDQYERLFGSRRGDLNNTSLHGPLTPANLSAPGLRLQIRPSETIDARLKYGAAYLASATDAWVVAGLRDKRGASGDFLGHALDGRVRWRALPGVTLEAGGSLFEYGEFAERVSGGPTADRAALGYVQITRDF